MTKPQERGRDAHERQSEAGVVRVDKVQMILTEMYSLMRGARASATRCVWLLANSFFPGRYLVTGEQGTVDLV